MGAAPLAVARASEGPVGQLNWAFVGAVYDGDGEPIAGAVVSDGDTSAVTNSVGEYALPEWMPGTYQLHVSRSCYASASRQATVLVPHATTLDFQLTLIDPECLADESA
jgi:uncharacterized membrane protein